MAWLKYDHFLGSDVLGFSSDSGLDFLRGDPSSPEKFHMTEAQRSALAAAGVPGGIIFPKQVHGDVIWEAGVNDIASAGIVEADAVLTTVQGLAVAVRTADCLPLLMFAPSRNVIAAVHAGWKSTGLNIAAKTVALMNTKYDVDPAGILAVIGPCIRPLHYSVGIEFKKMFPADVVEKDGSFYFDMVAANRAQIEGQGVCARNILDCGCDTYSDKSWHSFRRDAEASGRLIHVIMMKPWNKV